MGRPERNKWNNLQGDDEMARNIKEGRKWWMIKGDNLFSAGVWWATYIDILDK